MWFWGRKWKWFKSGDSSIAPTIHFSQKFDRSLSCRSWHTFSWSLHSEVPPLFSYSKAAPCAPSPPPPPSTPDGCRHLCMHVAALSVSKLCEHRAEVDQIQCLVYDSHGNWQFIAQNKQSMKGDTGGLWNSVCPCHVSRSAAEPSRAQAPCCGRLSPGVELLMWCLCKVLSAYSDWDQVSMSPGVFSVCWDKGAKYSGNVIWASKQKLLFWTMFCNTVTMKLQQILRH